MSTPPSSGDRLLAASARLWFATAMAGQWAFVWFILAYFGARSVGGDWAALNDKPHITGYVPGDSLGNAQWLLHVFVGAVVTVAGMLQLLPWLRRRWPALHRWNGRMFMLTAAVATLSGFWLTWVRGSQLNLPSAVSTSLNGALILVFAALAWRSALRRQMAEHRRHAVRAYLLVNGVWFLRIGIVPVGAVMAATGHDMGYDSAAFLAVSVLSWVAPLACTELYFAAEAAPRQRPKYLVAAVFVALALLTVVGGGAALMVMWLPAVAM